MAEEKGPSKGLTGFLGGVSDLVEKLEKLAEAGGELSKSGSFPTSEEGEDRPPMKGVYGFSVKVGGLGDKDKDRGYKVEPFGNVRRDRTSGKSVMDEVREPLVDIFDEDDRLLIVAEMPGVEPEDLKVDLSGTTLTLSAGRGQHKYRKSIDVPEGMKRDQISVTCRNGIIEVTCAKGRSAPEGGHG